MEHRSQRLHYSSIYASILLHTETYSRTPCSLMKNVQDCHLWYPSSPACSRDVITYTARRPTAHTRCVKSVCTTPYAWFSSLGTYMCWLTLEWPMSWPPAVRHVFPSLNYVSSMQLRATHGCIQWVLTSLDRPFWREGGNINQSLASSRFAYWYAGIERE